MSTHWPCLSATADGRCLLTVAVIPNARRTEAVGLHDSALRVRLASPPIEGRANEALVAWLAQGLDLPKRGVELRHGATSRRKRLLLDCGVEKAAAWLDGLGLAVDDGAG